MLINVSLYRVCNYFVDLAKDTQNHFNQWFTKFHIIYYHKIYLKNREKKERVFIKHVSFKRNYSEYKKTIEEIEYATNAGMQC